MKLTPKWKDLSFAHIFRYLQACVTANKAHSFLIVAQLIKSLANFDSLLEAKLITHLLLEGTSESIRKESAEDGKLSLNCVVI